MQHITKLRKQKSELLKAIRLASYKQRELNQKIVDFKRAVKKFPKSELPLYLEQISKMCMEVDARYNNLKRIQK